MRRYSCIHVKARSEYCCKRSAGICDEAMPEAGSSAASEPGRPEEDAAPDLAEACPAALNNSTIMIFRPKPGRKAVPPQHSTNCTQFLYQVCQNYPAKRY